MVKSKGFFHFISVTAILTLSAGAHHYPMFFIKKGLQFLNKYAIITKQSPEW